MWIPISIWYFFFFLKRYILTLLIVQACWWLILSFVCLKKSTSTLLLKDMFTGYRIQDWFFFLSTVPFKGIASLSFHWIVAKAAVIFVLLYITCVNFSGCFSDFLFTTVFEQLDYDALCHFSFSFHVSCVCGPLSFLVLVTLFFFNQILKNFGHFYLKIFFDLSFFLLYHRDSSYMSNRLLEVITESTMLYSFFVVVPL